MSRGLVNNMLTMNNLGDGSTLSLDFTTMGGVLDPRLTFSRASGGTYVGSDGYIYGVDSATSASLAIGTGSKSVTLTATAGVDRRFQVGQTVYFSSGANNMSGLVTAYSASTQVITINATATTGSGSFTSWFVGNASPRFDYSPTNIGEPRGLLVEGNVANFITQSQTLSNAANYGMLAISIDGTVPDPMNGAETKKIAASFSATSAFHGFVQFFVIAATGTETVSIFAKKNNYKYLFMADAITNTIAVRFNLETGVVDLPVASGGAKYVSSKMTPYPNGWYRCEMTATVTATQNFGLTFVGVPDTGATYAVTGASYPGSVNSNDGIYAIGLQAEAGSGASSYIPTGASQVTRNKDSMTLSDLSALGITNTAGTLVADFTNSTENSNYAANLSFRSAVGSTYASRFRWGSNLLLTTYFQSDGSTGFTTNLNGSRTSFARCKAATSYSYDGTTTSVFGSMNGAAMSATSTTTQAASIAIPTSLRWNDDGSTPSATDYSSLVMRSVKYYPSCLTIAQMNTLTTL
jgi:hypothetical protein